MDETYLITSFNSGFKTFYSDDPFDNSDYVQIKAPNMNLISEQHIKDKNLPVYKFIQSIPKEIRQCFLMYNIMYLQIDLLQLCSKSYVAKDLFLSNPLLLLMWLSKKNIDSRLINSDAINQLLGRKQKDILAELYPREKISKSSLKLLRKINLINGDGFEIDLIFKNLFNKKTSILRHLNVIPVILINLFNDKNCHLSPVLYKDLRQTMSASVLKERIIETTTKMSHINAMTGDDEDIHDAIKQCKSIESLNILHNKILHQYLNNKNDFDRIFPEAPRIKDKPGFVERITQRKELVREGVVMKSCIASLSDVLDLKKNFFFRVFSPERCSLHIVYKAKLSTYSIKECRLYDNKEPSSETVMKINEWLNGINYGLNQ